MPKICKLCAHERRAEIDRFMLHGSSYRRFRERFDLRSVSVYCWSRHKAHIADRVEAQASEPSGADQGQAFSFDASNLRGINRKLKVLAVRAEKSGRPAHAIAAYAAMSRNLETLEKFAAKRAGNAVEAPTLNVIFRTPEEVEAARVQARAAIREADPENVVLRQLEDAEAGVLPVPEPQPQPKSKRGNLDVWADLDKDKGLPN